MNVAIVTAGGVGSRMNSRIPKQFITVNDIPILIYTLKKFEQHPLIDAIIVPCLKDWQSALLAYKREYNITKLQWVVDGGSTGAESIMNCLQQLQNICKKDDVIIVNDGNRPLVSDAVLNDALNTYKQHGNAVACVPTTEVVVRKAPNAICSSESINRDELFRTQTPHVFSYGDLYEMYTTLIVRGDEPVAPCDAAIKLGREIYLSKGSDLNFKITTQDDLQMFKALHEQVE